MTVSTIDRPASQSRLNSTTLLAFSALASTILLVAMGSIVRVTGYGLGCPDWPLCYGQPIPPALTGAWVEFVHRLLGAVTGLQIVLLALLVWRQHRDRPWLVKAAVGAIGLLAVQVGLGGLHVILEIPPETGLLHTGTAMLIVGLVALQVAGIVPALRPLRESDLARDRSFRRWLSLTALVTYGLLLTGSYVTRTGASLACPAFPWCGPPATSRLASIQMLHRYVAFGVAFLALVLVGWVMRRHREGPPRRFALGLGLLLALQFGLGITNVLLRLPMWSRILHLTVAATFWAGLVILWGVSHPFRSPLETRG